MKISRAIGILLAGSLLMTVTGCATLTVTERKVLTPATEKQQVHLGVQATGDRLQEALTDADGQLVKIASGQLFDKVTLLPKESKFMQPTEMKAVYGVDYVLAVGISDISVNGDLNPYWFASLPLLFFKIYTPIVSFEPGISLDVTLRDAASGAALMQKQVMESSSDHYAPSNPGPKVRKLISLTISNALVSIMRDSQLSIAAARKGRP